LRGQGGRFYYAAIGKTGAMQFQKHCIVYEEKKPSIMLARIIITAGLGVPLSTG